MKTLFKKASSGEARNTRTPTKHQGRTREPTTPPVTPSPTKESNISVRIIASQRETVPPSASLSQQPVTPDEDDESTLFNTVLGMGCGGSPIWEGGSVLAPIPEENDVRSEWGRPPSNDENSIESANYDDYEVILQSENLNMSRESNKSADMPIYCQPCGEVNARQSSAEEMPSQKKKKRFKMPKMKSKKEKSESKPNVKSKKSSKPKTEQAPTSTAVPTKTRKAKEERRNSIKEKKEKKAPNSPKKQIGKLFQSKTNKKKSKASEKAGLTQKRKSTSKRGRWKCAHDPNSGKVYFYHTLTKEVTWDRPAAFVEWRVAVDAQRRRFYYNAITKKTQWDKPDEFVEWAEVKDEKSGRFYYYNLLTKKTTWTNPNIQKKEISTAPKPVARTLELVERKKVSLTGVNDKSTPNEGEQDSDQVIIVSDLKGDYEETDNHEDEQSQDLVEEESNQVSKQEDLSTPPRAMSKSPVNEPGGIVMKNEHERLAAMLSTYCPNEKENNSQLLEKCRGNEARHIKGIQGLVEDTPFDELNLAIFAYVKSSLLEMGEEPFDERLRKKNPRRPPVTQKSSSNSINRVQSSAGYSMNSRILSHATGRSVVTNLTEQTNRINNTSNRTLGTKSVGKDPKDALAALNERWTNMNLDNSLDNSYEDLTDDTDEDQVKDKVVLDMKEMEKEDDLHRVSSRLDIMGGGPSNPNPTPRETTGGIKQSNHHVLIANNNIDDTGDAETLESAYAGDADEEADETEWDDDAEDDVSALSDSFGPSNSKRIIKEKSSIAGSSVEQSFHKEKAKKILSKYARESGASSGQYAQLITNRQNSASEKSSVGYEELPRLNSRGGNRRNQDMPDDLSWDDDTVTTNESS